ncbi:hypothetical protein KJ980_03390 [Patescibacteria group bacterium]|nr:hypothetical protein [Patescibacteria group bacterium]MBU4016208.1 hypothetical protein [Patescibacteria group bacterium]MBU4098666.1 hypothetical protein [Patescibacteria group bacterium]
MNNYSTGNTKKEFYIWIDINNPVIFNNFNVGSLNSASVFPENDNLSFLPNPRAGGFVSLFHANLIWKYRTEYNLELSRGYYYKIYPSRLEAIYLLPSYQEAVKYKQKHQEHIKDRLLKKVFSVDDYIYSTHDTGWIDFCHRIGMMDQETQNNVYKSYWQGIRVCDCQLQSQGKPWTSDPVIEILFLGRVDFYNNKLIDDK